MPLSVVIVSGVCRVLERPKEVEDGARMKEEVVGPHRVGGVWSWPWPKKCES